jgi:hypothetical protein
VVDTAVAVVVADRAEAAADAATDLRRTRRLRFIPALRLLP